MSIIHLVQGALCMHSNEVNNFLHCLRFVMVMCGDDCSFTELQDDGQKELKGCRLCAANVHPQNIIRLNMNVWEKVKSSKIGCILLTYSCVAW